MDGPLPVPIGMSVEGYGQTIVQAYFRLIKTVMREFLFYHGYLTTTLFLFRKCGYERDHFNGVFYNFMRKKLRNPIHDGRK